MAKSNNQKRQAAAAKGKKALKAKHIAFVVADVEKHRNSKGRIPRGVLQRVFSEHKEVISWLTIDLVKKGLKKAKNVVPVVVSESTMSDLTNPTFEASQDMNEATFYPPRNISITQELEVAQATSKPKGGRPRGTTLKALREKEAKKEALVNDIATTWSGKVEQEKSEGGQVRMKKKRVE